MPGRLWDGADYDDVAALRRLGERLYALHRLPPPAIEAFDPWRVAQAYLRQIDAAQAAALERAAAAPAGACSAELGTGDARHDGGARGSVAGQPAAGIRPRLWLLDWEYAQLSDPLMDVACVLAYYPARRALSRRTGGSRGLRRPRAGDRPCRRAYYIYRALSWLWHLARGEQAEPP